MSNPFATWSIADAELHNVRVGNGSGKGDIALVTCSPKNSVTRFMSFDQWKNF
jgi:hypothetical protein